MRTLTACLTVAFLVRPGFGAAPAPGSAWDDLTVAMNQKDYGLAYKLVEAKPELARMTNESGWSALHVAAKQEQVDLEAALKLIRLLLDKGADANLKIPTDPNGIWTAMTPLHFAAGADAYEIARLLIERGADPLAANGKGGTPLHSAAFYGNKPLAELLLLKEAPIDARNAFGRAPLHEAVSQGQYHLALFLLQKGADVDARDENRVTPLHLAVLNESINLARLLLDRKADPNARDSDGKTPLAWAEPAPEEQDDYDAAFGAKINPEMIELIKRYGGTK
ncbi:MAG: ankyrin repeat domain-containing protein [Elusimicrobia bacterium]|nr:ankyrin repeat domain-containing protein [Elusimicrobiota bacterium]